MPVRPMRVLVTAGPTREPLDPVRFLSNRSSGRVGFALAEEIARRGHEPLLVLGPTDLQPPIGAHVYAVETAVQMHDAALDFLDDAGAVICAAAVSDFRPARPSERKIKRSEMRAIELVENPDVAAAIGAARGERPHAIFALETDDAFRNARAKMERKNADLCVLNDPDAISARGGRFRILRRGGETIDLGETTKEALAAALLDAMGL